MRRSALAERYQLDGEAVVLREVEASDQAFLADLYATTREDELSLVEWPSDAERRAFLDLQFRAQREHYTRHYPQSDHRLIVRGGVPVGRIWVHAAESAVTILDMALLPSERGRGIGALLVEELVRDAASTSTPLKVCVQKLNPRSLNLLVRLGFTVYEEDASNVWLSHPATEAAVA